VEQLSTPALILLPDHWSSVWVQGRWRNSCRCICVCTVWVLGWWGQISWIHHDAKPVSFLALLASSLHKISPMLLLYSSSDKIIALTTDTSSSACPYNISVSLTKFLHPLSYALPSMSHRVVDLDPSPQKYGFCNSNGGHWDRWRRIQG
jgi:hypothetical protein